MFDEFEDVRKKAVEIALEEAKKNTVEVGAQNRGERIDVYLRNAHALSKNAPADQAGLAWCGMFIYYCYSKATKQLGKILPFRAEALWGGSNLKNWSDVYLEKIVDDPPILPGDIYIMNSFHIGMVIAPVDNFKVVKTIDGNQSGVNKGGNSVRKKERSYYDMYRIIRI
jgi:hypothetical protein